MANTCSQCSEPITHKDLCSKHYRLWWNTKNRDKVNEYSKRWKKENKVKIQKQNAKRYLKKKILKTSSEKEEGLLKQCKSYQKHKLKRLAQKKIKYNQRDKVLHKEKKRKQAYKRYHTNPQARLANICRKRLTRVLEKKTTPTSALIGCSWQELKQDLESKFYPNSITGEVMSWDNLGKCAGHWQIDHIRPFKNFDLTDLEQLKQVCQYTNLQPLWWEDHLKKTLLDNSESINFVKEI